MKYRDYERAIIWLDSFADLSREQKLKLIRKIKQPELLLTKITDLKEYVTDTFGESGYNTLVNASNEEYVEKLIEDLEGRNIKAITCMSEQYPETLLNTDAPPLMLYARGNVELLAAKNKLSIVGSRKSLPFALKTAESYSKRLSHQGVVMVTGIAEGADSAVIRGALDSGNIISVLAYGMNYVYPSCNADLIKKLGQNGLLITEHSPNVAPKPYMFPERNRIIAGLSPGTLVVSGGKKSGTLLTAGFAIQYGKQVFALPYSLDVMSGEGCNSLIKNGAHLVDSIDDLCIFCGINVVDEQKPTLSQREQKVLEIIEECEVHIDEITERSGLSVAELTPILMLLEIKKYIIKNPGNTFTKF